MTQQSRSYTNTLKVLAIVIGLLIAGLSIEAGLRVADRAGWINLWAKTRTALNNSIWTKSANPQIVFQHRPNYYSEGVQYTEQSGILRPSDVSEQAPDGTFRIAVLGDSVAAAVKLPYEERVFTQVENGLSALYPEKPIEVLNFGVQGYSTQQEAALLGELVDRFAPDLLIVQYCMNDFHPSEYPYAWFVEQSPLHLIDFVKDLLERPTRIGYPPANYWETLYREDRQGWQNVADGFARIVTYARDRHIPVLLVIFPLISKGGWYEADARKRHEQVASLGVSAGFDVLDLLPIYAEHDIDSVRFKPWDTFHPNAFGHEIAAEAIIRWLSDEDLPGLSSP